MTIDGDGHSPAARGSDGEPMLPVVCVFGPVAARGPTGPIELTRAKERAVLAVLALFHGRAVSTDRLVDAVWGDRPPLRAEKGLQTHVQRLRVLLGPGVVQTRSDGYALASSVVVDAELFEAEARADGPAPRLRDALGRWSGEPYVDLGEWPPAELERERLNELRDHARETCLGLEIEAGDAAGCIAELEAMVAEKPLRERRWLLLMTALHRAGRVADALRTYQRARAVFAEELGIDPGPDIRALEEQILLEGVESDGGPAAESIAGALPSGVVTFLLTDVEGSTELWDRDAAGTSRALLRHDALIEGAVAAAGGRLLKSHGEGDSTFSVFTRATEALSAALAARRAIDAEDWPDGVRLEVRFALHMGEVEERDGEYYGAAVNRAARIRALAVGGQILTSQAVAEVVRDHLADDVSLVELGEQHLRGLAHPERVWAAVDAARPVRVREAIGGMCPYKGLLAFEPEDRDVFFGREASVGLLLDRLLARRFVVLVGASGSGKSSVVRAGVVAALARGEVPGSERWSAVIGTPGEHPLGALSAEVVDHAHATQRAVLVVDQMEELFTACSDASERERYVDELLDAVEQADGRVLVACALRADFFGHCAAIPRLAAALSDATVLLGTMTDRELRRAIEAPAEIAGLRLETGLVDVMLRDLAHEPGSLPLLSHALLETWRRRSGRTLTLRGYQESGGVRGAIAKTAEAVWTDALTEQLRPIARRIFLRLTELGDGTEDTRRRVARSELVSGTDADNTDQVLGLLVDRRLVTADDATVQVAHEALIREWPRLRGWLDEDREGLRAHRHLTHAAEDWVALGRATSELYRGPRLAATQDWLARDDTAQLNELETAFMEASEERERTERAAQARGARRIRRLLAATALLLVVALIGGFVAVRNAQVAHHRATVADSQRLAAQAKSLSVAHIDLALLLAVEARKLDDSVATRGALKALLSDGARLERFVPLGANTVSAVSRDGRMLAIGHDNGAVEVRDLASGRVISEFADGATAVGLLAFSADGRTLAISHQDGTIDLLDAATGTARAGRLTGLGGAYRWIILSPDGHRLAAADVDGDVVVWDLTSPVRSATVLSRSKFAIAGLAWSSNNRTLASSDANVGVTVYDAATGKSIRRIPLGSSSTQGLALGPNGRTLAVGTDDGRFNLVDLATGRSGPRFGESGPPMGWFAFSPDGATLAADNAAGAVSEWDLATGRERGQPLVGIGADAYSGVLGAGGRLVTLAPRTVAVWRTRSVGPALGRLAADFRSADAGVILSRDGSLAWMGAVAANHWILYDMLRDQVRATYPQTDNIALPAWSPDATTLAVPLADGRVRLVSAKTGAALGQFTGLRGPAGFPAFSPDGHALAAGGADGTVLVWDVATKRPLGAPFQDGAGAIQDVAFSPDAKVLAVSSLDGTLKMYDVATRRALHTYDVRGGVVLVIAFSPDGKTLAAASSPDGAILIDTATGRLLHAPLAGRSDIVLAVAFSRDGRTLATGSIDGTVILYDAATRQPIGDPLDAGDGEAEAVAFTPDGGTLAGSYHDGQVVLWDIDPDSWQQRACTTAGRNLTRDEWHQYLGNRPYHKTCPQWPTG